MKPAIALFALCAAFGITAVYAQEPAPAQIRYKSVAQAYDGVRANPRAEMLEDKTGWITIIIKGGPDDGIWAFTARSSPAFPAVVRRKVVEWDGKATIAMDVICQAKKEACDALVTEFQQVNHRMAEDLNKARAR